MRPCKFFDNLMLEIVNFLLFSTDVCVPISQLSTIIEDAEEIVRNSYANDLMYGFLGHVGDGNFHIFLPVNDEHFDRLKEISNSVALRKALQELS